MSQKAELHKYLKRKSITSREAFVELGITSLHRRLADLRNSGVSVGSRWVTVSSRYGTTKVRRYYLIKGSK